MTLQRPLRVLHLANFSRRRCGIANAGHQTSTALRRIGVTVTDWDIEYDHMYARIQRNKPAYLPPDVLDYDVVHYEWHPITTNTFGPAHFPWTRGEGPLVSVFLHDVPPWSGCPFHDRAEIRWTNEPSPGCRLLPIPVADWVTDRLPCDPTVFSIGLAGIRGDGVEEVRALCARYGWPVITPPADQWLPFEDAVRHQAQATVNVQWYHESRGKSGGASQAIASRRPVLLNDSLMFTHLHGYDDLYWGTDLEPSLVGIYQDWQHDRLRYPDRVIRERGWVRWGAPTLVQGWEEAIRG